MRFSSATYTPLSSRPSRARGLKHQDGLCLFDGIDVAPLAGAWIETMVPGKYYQLRGCRAPRGRVD